MKVKLLTNYVPIATNCDWEVIDEDEWELRNEAENQIEQEQINKHLN